MAFSLFRRKILLIKLIKDKCFHAQIEFTRLLAECLYWAFSIVVLEKDQTVLDEVKMEDFLDKLVSYIGDNIKVYKNVRSSFAGEFKKRYEVTANFFAETFDFSFKNVFSLGSLFLLTSFNHLQFSPLFSMNSEKTSLFSRMIFENLTSSQNISL